MESSIGEDSTILSGTRRTALLQRDEDWLLSLLLSLLLFLFFFSSSSVGVPREIALII